MAEANCKACGKHLTYDPSKQRGLYCNNSCQQAHRRQEFIALWKEGVEPGGKGNYLSNHVRNYLIEESSGCWECGWNGLNHHTGRPCLEIDHIDDDPFNHSPENLQVLCPNCHAQKTLPPQQSKGGRYSRGTKHPKHQAL